MLQDYVAGDNARKIYNDCEIKVSELLNADSINTFEGLENLDMTLSIFKDMHDFHVDYFDSKKFNELFDLKIETKYEFSSDPEYWETIKVVSLNTVYFMILVEKGDSGVMETIIDAELYNTFINALKKCFVYREDLEKPELTMDGILKF